MMLLKGVTPALLQTTAHQHSTRIDGIPESDDIQFKFSAPVLDLRTSATWRQIDSLSSSMP